MDTDLIIKIAKERILIDLCLKWYLEIDEKESKIIFDEIQIFNENLKQNK